MRAATFLVVLCLATDAYALDYFVQLFQRSGTSVQSVRWDQPSPEGRAWQSSAGDLADDVDAAVVDEDHIEIAGRDRTNRLVVRKQLGGEWQEWLQLSSVISSPPAIVDTRQGSHIIARGGDGRMLHHFRPVGAAAWQGGLPIPNGLFHPGTAPVAVTDGQQRVFLFARGMDTACYLNEWDGTRWIGWRKIGGLFRGDFGAAFVDGRLEVYGVGTTGVMFRNTRTATTDFNARWQMFGGEFESGIRPRAVVFGSEVMLIARGTNGSLWSRTLTRGWQDMSVPAFGNPAVVIPTFSLFTVEPSGYFRVTIQGFTVEQETNDDPRERHGARDEVWLWVQTGVAGTPRPRIFAARTMIFGDIHVFPTHVKAGSARGARLVGADGGLMTGDSVPDVPEPWAGVVFFESPVGDDAPTDPLMPGTVDKLPMLAWEGTLKRHGNAVVLLPMIIESDHTLRVARFTSALSEAAERLRSLAPGVPRGYFDAIPAWLGAEQFSNLPFQASNDDADRPIGLFGSDAGVFWSPRPIMLTYDLARKMVRTGDEIDHLQRRPDGSTVRVSRPAIPGIYAFTYEDMTRAHQGKYTLYWKIQRID